MISAISTVGLKGFTRLSKGLSAVLLIGHVASLLFPWIIGYVAVLPAKTIPYVWNVITAGYIEQSLFGLVLSVFGLLICGKLLEPIWTSREFVKFVFFVNIFTLLGVYLTAVTTYYITRRESFLYTPLSGFHGVLAGFLVGVKQAMPDQEITLLGWFNLRVEWLPSLLVLMTIILSVFTSEAMQYLPFVVFGTYGSWTYLRYIKRNPEINLRGDPHDQFAFATFFPKFLRPIVDFFASALHSLLCGKRNNSQKGDSDGPVSDSPSVLGFEAVDTSRRDRGAHVLEERLQGARDDEHEGEGHLSDDV